MRKDTIKIVLHALNEKKTWSAVTKIPGHKVIGTKRIFTIQRNEHGDVDRFKTRPVALGYQQTHGVGYYEIYSPSQI